MARETTWLNRLKTHFSHKLRHSTTKHTRSGPEPEPKPKPKPINILAFEVASILSRLLALHHSLTDPAILRLKNDVVSLHGVRKLISDDESFLLNLACAELIQSLHILSLSTTRLSHRCSNPTLQSFDHYLDEFSNTGRDPCNWVAAQCGKELDALTRRADRYIAATSALYREMEELKLLQDTSVNKKKSGFLEENSHSLLETKQKIVWQRQQVNHVKEKSLWNKSFDSVVLLLARLIFTILARIKLVFGIGHTYPPLPRSLSASATVFPSMDLGNPTQVFVSGPLIQTRQKSGQPSEFFESRTKVLKPPPTTLGAAALALHYGNLIIVLEKMIKAPHLVGLDAREDVYNMLPCTIRSNLRARLKGVGFSASDPILAGEWRDALARILSWLAPLAHNMIKWQNERSFEQHNLMPKLNNILLLQTLYFANQDKTEAAITELLVGLNYIWRFEREMNAKALLECSYYFNSNHNKLQNVNF